MSTYDIRIIVQRENVIQNLFLNADFETERDEDMRDYIVDRYLDATTERDPKTGNRYWVNDGHDMGEIIDRILEDPDAPAGIAEWYEEH